MQLGTFIIQRGIYWLSIFLSKYRKLDKRKGKIKFGVQKNHNVYTSRRNCDRKSERRASVDQEEDMKGNWQQTTKKNKAYN